MGILGHGRESVGIAVKATDVLFVLAWSNVAFTLRGIANLRPKDGGEAVPLTVDAAMNQLRTSATAAFAAEEKLIAVLHREGLLQ